MGLLYRPFPHRFSHLTPVHLLRETLTNSAPESRLLPRVTFLPFSCSPHRFWKDIFGILDLTKIRSGIRENGKYLDGKRELTALDG